MAAARVAGRVPPRGVGFFRQPGLFLAFSLDVLRGAFRRPFQWRETLQQSWFIASVSILPTVVFSFAFGGTIAVLVANLFEQFGASSFTGAAAVLATVRNAGPIITALFISGAGGTAVCADLGSRKIREEIDALQVLGIDPLHRMVVPRVIGAVVVAFFLSLLSIFVGVAGGYTMNVILEDGQPGVYISSFGVLARISDLYLGLFKGVAFGLIAGLIACYKGLTAAGGPKGVGDAVNQSVVFSFILLYFVNYVLSTVYFQLVGQQGL